jgi:hypothetical protein
MLETMLLSHVGDGATEAAWPRRDIDAESCYWQFCRVMLVRTLLGKLQRGAV